MPLSQDFIDLVNSPAVASELAARDFNAMADVLNAPTERGPVPIREVSSACLSLGVTGYVLALSGIPIGTDIMPGVPMTLAIMASLQKILTLVQNDYRLETADCDHPSFAAGCDGLIALGILDADGKAALLALGENRRGKAEVALGRKCTGIDCFQASGGD
jgi:hypothetical protein